MTERDDNYSNHQYETDFIDIIDATETRDAGITSFERKMDEFRDKLLKKYKGKPIFKAAGIPEAQDQLDDLWMHNNSTARVSGRIYIDDPALVDEVPREWGDGKTDEDGNEYYFVENAPLRSHGVFIDSVTDDEDTPNLADVKIGFAFALPSDLNEQDERQPAFIAYPGELSRHTYEAPTPEEAELRLQRQWPSEYQLLQKYFSPETKGSLVERIEAIQKRLQPQLVEHTSLRVLLEAYLDEKLALNRQFPYIVTVKDALFCYEGQDIPYSDQYQGTWTKLQLKDTFTAAAYEPTLRTFVHQNGTVTLDFILEVFNESSDESEFIRVPIEHMTSLRSSRAQQAILERVMLLNENDVKDEREQLHRFAQHVDTDVVVKDLAPDDQPLPEHSEFFSEMMVLRDGLAEVQRLVSEAQQKIYATPEEAVAAGELLVREKIEPLLIGAGVFNSITLKVSGPGVFATKQQKDENGTDNLPYVALHAVDIEHGLIPIEAGDVLEGAGEKIVAMYKSTTKDDEGVPKDFVVDPTLLVITDQKNKTLYGLNGLRIVDSIVTTRALVSLDDTVDIQVKQLDIYEQAGEIIVNAIEEYGAHPIIEGLKTLRESFAKERQHKTVSFDDGGLLLKINTRLNNVIESKLSPRPALEALETLFYDRYVQIMTPAQDENGEINGKVVDVEYDQANKDLKLAIQVREDSIMHVRFADIIGLSF